MEKKKNIANKLLCVINEIKGKDSFGSNVFEIIKTLKDSGYQAYVVGGSVRDKLLGRVPKDIDISTNATPDEIEGLFDKTLPIGKSFGVIVVVMPNGEQYEVATFRSDGNYSDSRRPDSISFERTSKGDASRRDFTINSMFLDPITGDVEDYFGGQEDLDKKVIRTVGDSKTRFEEDKLRMLRAVRFSLTLGFTMSEEVKEAIKENAHKITSVSKERIKEELIKMLKSGSPGKAILFLEELGLLEYILPEVSSLRGVEQSPDHHPEGDVLTHTVILMNILKDKPYQVILAGLLHDTGKPSTQTINHEKGKIQFLKHEEESAKIADEVLRRLKFTNVDREEIVFLVKNHMVAGRFNELKLYKKRMLSFSKYFDELIELAVADQESTGMDATHLREEASKIKNMPKEDLLINSKDLKDLEIKPGKIYSKIFNSVWKSQLDGKTRTKEEALNIAKSMKNS